MPTIVTREKPVSSTRGKARAAAAPSSPPSFGSHKQLIALSLAALAAKSLVFEPVGWWPLSFVCLVPWLLIVAATTHAPRAYAYAYLFAVVFFLLNMKWMAGVTVPGYVALSLYLAAYFPMMAVAVRHAARRRGWSMAMVFPFVWVGGELLRAIVMSGFPWFFLSHGVYRVLPLIQFSDLIGAYGVSFLIAGVNGALADGLLRRFRLGATLRPGRFHRWAGLSFAASLVVTSLVYGWFQLRSGTQSPGPKIALLQGDFLIAVDRDEVDDREKRRIYFELLDAAAKDAPDLFLLPETPWIMYLNKEARNFFAGYRQMFDRFRDFAIRHGAYLVTGSASLEQNPKDLVAPEKRFNSAMVFRPDGSEPGRYDKVHLVYFGETLPFRFGKLRFIYLWLNRLMPFNTPEGNWEYSLFHGDGFHTFEMTPKSTPDRTYRFGVPICYEDVMPYIARAFVSGDKQVKQADFLLNISNDGWFGRGHQQKQHLATCVYRAVENRVGIARAVNTGVSAFIDPSGRVHDAVTGDPKDPWPRDVGYRVANVMTDSRYSFYSRHGDWFAWLCVIATAALIVDYAAVRFRARRAEGDSESKSSRGRGHSRPSVTAIAWGVGLPGFVGVLGITGCAAVPRQRAVSTAESPGLRDRALLGLESALRFPDNPVVRAQAVEALQDSGSTDALPLIRLAMTDEHPGVRFAACVALGVLKDHASRSRLESMASDKDASVSAAAVFALHRLGDDRHTGRLSALLLEHKEPTVRRNAALLLGMLGEPGSVKLLARAMRDNDAGVRDHALEAMARLGNREAAQELSFMANSGVGSVETFAVTALSNTGSRLYLDLLRYKLGSAVHLETRLAAARGLGLLGEPAGYDEAIRALSAPRAATPDPNDPPAEQRLRTLQLASAALGAIGSPSALPPLERVMRADPDPRVQVAAAAAIAKIRKGSYKTYDQDAAVVSHPEAPSRN